MRVVGLFILLSLTGCTCAGPKLQIISEEDAGLPPECLPTVELCNGRDDDCDLLVDEEQPSVECGIGACKRTISTCLAGAPQTLYPKLNIQLRPASTFQASTVSRIGTAVVELSPGRIQQARSGPKFPQRKAPKTRIWIFRFGYSG